VFEAATLPPVRALDLPLIGPDCRFCFMCAN
jgi:hypothetical protein